MRAPQYVGPRRGHLPALEQNILKFRAFQMILTVFNAEELRREIQHAANHPGDFETSNIDARPPRSVKQALAALEKDGIFSNSERAEIVKLIDYRNVIAHQIHDLTADLSNTRFVRERARYHSDQHKFDYQALERLTRFRDLLPERLRQRGRVVTVGFSDIVFEAAEKTYTKELSRLDRRIVSLMKKRRHEIEQVNAELQLDGTEFEGRLHPLYALNRYGSGRLTKRGIEIAYRLFDIGKSPMAVAYFMDLSFSAAKHHYKLWRLAGGKDRVRRDI